MRPCLELAAPSVAHVICQTLIVFSAACSGDVLAEERVLRDLDRLDVTPETVIGATDIVVTARGDLVLLDNRHARIIVLDSAGRLLRVFGREGSGPGELRYPDTIVLRGDTVFVANRPNGRLELFLTDGTSLGSRALPLKAMDGATAYQPDGAYLASTGGRDSALALLLVDGSTNELRLGTPVPGARLPLDYPELRKVIAQGAVPVELMNSVRPVLDSRRTPWLIVNARGAVQRYCTDGTLLWEQLLGEATMDSAKSRFFARNLAETNPNRLHLVSPFGQARAVGEGLWVLLREEFPGTRFVVFRGPSEKAFELQMPDIEDVSAFDVDSVRRALVLVTAEPSGVVRVPLPGALWRDLVGTSQSPPTACRDVRR